ncbi:helix-turn-helix transcriptional regulator [Methylomonas koyamae]|uniref:helix-turn-helix transcriptional regulator n=1 Tax=Methylomonas koyamae TaxID=702114 RepID=UPI002872BF13|nr:AlpA family phage regulatory protein [Methylomonas koyamae]WNB74116.1 AlpA family phage regulatory protein [Methylomonas koyamae]
MIDLEAVSEVTGLSESTIQSLIRADEFPKPRKASARRTCWLLREIEEWAESRPVSDLLPPPNTATGGRNGKPNRLLKFANLPSVSAPFFEAPGGLEA